MLGFVGETFSHYFNSPLFYGNNSLANQITQNETQKVIELIKERPELLNQKFSGGYLPITLALKQRNFELVNFMMLRGAHVNKGNREEPSVVDQLINKNDGSLNDAFFGKILSHLINRTKSEIDALTSRELYSAKLQAYNQFQDLESDVSTFNSYSKSYIFDNPIIEHTFDCGIEKLKDYLTEHENLLTEKHVFDALVWAIFSHHNEMVAQLISHYGSELLTVETSNLKNLYHLATIANNPSLIIRLAEWGLKLKPMEVYDTLGVYSPYHYALLNSSLSTFWALSIAMVPYPADADLKARKSLLLEGTQDQKTLNPTQMLILKAYINDPLEKNNKLKLLAILLELLPHLAKYSPINLPREYVTILSLLIKLVKTSLLGSLLINEVNHSYVKSFVSILSNSLFYGSMLALSFRKVNFLNIPIARTYQWCFGLLLIQKIFKDFKKYQRSYLLRPWSTFKAVVLDQTNNFFALKNVFWDISRYISEAQKMIANETLKFDFSSDSFCLSDPEKTFDPQILEEKNSLQKLFETITEKNFRCAFNSHATSGASFIEELFNFDPPLSKEKHFKILRREFLKRLHPDKCQNPPYSFSENFCNEVKETHWESIEKWFL